MIAFGSLALSFLTSRIGMAAIALVAGYLWGYHAADKAAAVDALQSELAAVRADLATSKVAADRAVAEADGLRNLQTELKGKLDEYAAELSSRPDGDSCRLDDADVKRLRGVSK